MSGLSYPYWIYVSGINLYPFVSIHLSITFFNSDSQMVIISLSESHMLNRVHKDLMHFRIKHADMVCFVPNVWTWRVYLCMENLTKSIYKHAPLTQLYGGRVEGAFSVALLLSNSIREPLQTWKLYIIILPMQLPIVYNWNGTCNLSSACQMHKETLWYGSSLWY